MSGAFQTSRDIFENPIWKNIVEFRLFFLIYGMAVFSDEGVRLADDLVLKRGEWCRSTRKLQEDLTYVENRQIKTYSTSVVHRAIVSLVKAQRLCTRTHELGTVFTVVNYGLYQGFDNYKKDNMERNLEQSGNNSGTISEQYQNNNKNVNNDNNLFGSGGNSPKNVFGMYQSEIGGLSDTIKEELIHLELEYSEEWVFRAIREAVMQDVKKMAYIKGTLKNWKTLNVDEPWLIERPNNVTPFPRGGQTNARHETGHAGRTDAELDALSL